MEYDAEISDWVNGGGVILGVIHGDKKGRFKDGTHIHTSTIEPYDQFLCEGAVITTKNSKYLLGKINIYQPR